MARTKRQTQRYWLHYRVRKQGFRLSARSRTIYFTGDIELTAQVEKLRDTYGYSVQSEIN